MSVFMLVLSAVQLEQAQNLLDRFCNNFHTTRTLANVIEKTFCLKYLKIDPDLGPKPLMFPKV